jgi:hypothetical protein
MTKVASTPPDPSSDVPPELPEPLEPPSGWPEPPEWLEPLELPEAVEPLLPLSRPAGVVFPHDAISGSAPPPAAMARARTVRNERRFIDAPFRWKSPRMASAVEHPPKPDWGDPGPSVTNSGAAPSCSPLLRVLLVTSESPSTITQEFAVHSGCGRTRHSAATRGSRRSSSSSSVSPLSSTALGLPRRLRHPMTSSKSEYATGVARSVSSSENV